MTDVRKRPNDSFVNDYGYYVKFSHLWMDYARRAAMESTAIRSKIGCVIVHPTGAVFTGYNGTAPGESNSCETDNVTNPDVYHAEENALDKMHQAGIPATGSVVYVTSTPCIICARRLRKAGVVLVVYDQFYRLTEGKNFLEGAGIPVVCIDDIPLKA